MPMSPDFERRLLPVLDDIANHFGTPFHIYDEAGIRRTGETVKAVFGPIPGFREYYAVKALPNPRILEIMREMGFGCDCSSVAELILSRRAGCRGEEIMFTSNNTTADEFKAAMSDGGSLINLDDITLIDVLPKMPECICFRYNPGPRRTGNRIIGNPVEAKYGLSHEQMLPAYRRAMEMGAKRFGIHTMLASNERNHTYMVETARALLNLAREIGDALGIRFDFLNIGGGLGIAYRPDDIPLDFDAMSQEIVSAFEAFRVENGYMPALFMESGRYMTGPHGVLVTRAINRKSTYREYVGVDACMSALMRPGMYGAYHHVTVPGSAARDGDEIVDVVGSLCENNDKFAVQRRLPVIRTGDLVLIHDTGAHGHSMGFNYNGKLRPKEILLRPDGSAELIRREETMADHFATLDFAPDAFVPNPATRE